MGRLDLPLSLRLNNSTSFPHLHRICDGRGMASKWPEMVTDTVSSLFRPAIRPHVVLRVLYTAIIENVTHCLRNTNVYKISVYKRKNCTRVVIVLRLYDTRRVQSNYVGTVHLLIFYTCYVIMHDSPPENAFLLHQSFVLRNTACADLKA